MARRLPSVVLPTLTMVALLSTSAEAQVCVPTQADPSTYLFLEDVSGRSFYAYEASPHPVLANPLVPGSGFLTGQGTFLYEETNMFDGLQRALQVFLNDSLPPGCDRDPNWQVTHGTIPCIVYSYDLVTDEHCGAGPDSVVYGIRQA